MININISDERLLDKGLFPTTISKAGVLEAIRYPLNALRMSSFYATSYMRSINDIHLNSLILQMKYMAKRK